MQLLISLGVWPEGIWREQPSHQHKQRFSGRMYKVGSLRSLLQRALSGIASSPLMCFGKPRRTALGATLTVYMGPFVKCHGQRCEAGKCPRMSFMLLCPDGILLWPPGFVHSWRQTSG